MKAETPEDTSLYPLGWYSRPFVPFALFPRFAFSGGHAETPAYSTRRGQGRAGAWWSRHQTPAG